jgi:AcrR family transcriptional regulator
MLPAVGKRSEAAAATRQALLDAAGALLDAGGPEAVTLREVGARTGVSRSAPYRHFADKDALLTVLATNAVTRLGDTLEELSAGDDPPERTLRSAVLSLIAIGRTRPHLYRLVFTTPTGDPTAAVLAAERTWGLFITIVGRVVGPEQARRYGAVLLTNAHGIAGLEGSRHRVWDEWQISAEELVDDVIALLPTDG